ncbi:right-handed parallel beta-helix repeat-containing protein [Micromonospora sp. NPDC048063]|uniref:right-handed parallel beta-helix repeat-containing protein n=1 Tax=Micromonospora sp. NPDC048063 TaxID=3364256 RepID=UPI003711A0DE
MSTYQGNRRAAPTRRRSRWFLAGGLVAGTLVAGVAGGVAVAAGALPVAPETPSLVLRGDDSGAEHRDDRREQGRAALGGQPSGDPAGQPSGAAAGEPSGDRSGDSAGEHRGGEEGRDGYPDPGPGAGRRAEVAVPCDSTKLIAALVRANAEGGAHLRLAPKCTYELTHAFQQPDDYDGGIRDAREAADSAENPGDAEAPPRNPQHDRAGLPVIYHPITIRGEGATIERDVHAEAFRFFTVRDGGELTLSDVVLRNGLSAAEGGSIHVVHGASAVVERTAVVGSTSLSAEGGGGGIFNDGNMVVVDSTFVDNHAAGKAGKGGGLLNGGVLTLRTSDFRNNTAVAYGGGLGNYRGAAEVRKSTFAHNNAAQGGGIASFSARTRVADSKVLGNTAQTGGGIANSDALIFLRGLEVRDNTATGNGGGISTSQGLLPLDDSVVAGNTARGAGGGIYAAKSNLLVRHSEVDRNHAVGAASTGGGVFATQGQVSLYRSRVSDNTATGKPGGLFADKARVRVDDETDIVDNEPTNCEGSRVPVANCFR